MWKKVSARITLTEVPVAASVLIVAVLTTSAARSHTFSSNLLQAKETFEPYEEHLLR